MCNTLHGKEIKIGDILWHNDAKEWVHVSMEKVDSPNGFGWVRPEYAAASPRLFSWSATTAIGTLIKACERMLKNTEAKNLEWFDLQSALSNYKNHA